VHGTGFLAYAAPDLCLKGLCGVAEEILPAETRRRESAPGPEAVEAEDLVNLIEAQVGHEDAVAEGVGPGDMSTMTKCACVEA
jgi:hypothetical protein